MIDYVSFVCNRLSGYIPTNFEYTTTNASMYKDFRFVDSHPPERTSKIIPKGNPIQTRSLPNHFMTTNSRELRKHKPADKVVDRIPYP